MLLTVLCTETDMRTVVDTLPAVITIFTGIDFVKVYKIPVICGHFRNQKPD